MEVAAFIEFWVWPTAATLPKRAVALARCCWTVTATGTEMVRTLALETEPEAEVEGEGEGEVVVVLAAKAAVDIRLTAAEITRNFFMVILLPLRG